MLGKGEILRMIPRFLASTVLQLDKLRSEHKYSPLCSTLFFFHANPFPFVLSPKWDSTKSELGTTTEGVKKTGSDKAALFPSFHQHLQTSFQLGLPIHLQPPEESHFVLYNLLKKTENHTTVNNQG